MAAPARLRPILDALALKLDGSPAAPSTVARKRSAFYSALDYAVELGILASNPMPQLKRQTTRQQAMVDRPVVVNPTQEAALIDAVRTAHPALEAFFAAMYYAGLRPAEARHLRGSNLILPDAG